jgi:hypothetical protein
MRQPGERFSDAMRVSGRVTWLGVVGAVGDHPVCVSGGMGVRSDTDEM